MKQTSSLFIFILLGLAMFSTACGPAGNVAAQTATPEATAENSIAVEATKVVSGTIAQFYTYAGDLQPQKSIDVLPEVTGKIDTVLVDVGDEVRRGEPLATIERDTFLAEFKQAQGALRAAQAELTRLEEGSRPEEISAARAAVQTARAQLSDVVTIDDDERTRAAEELAQARSRLRKAQADYDEIAWAGDVGQRPEAIELEQATNEYEAALANYNLDTTPRDSEVAPLMEKLAQAELNLALAIEPFRDSDFETAQANLDQAEAALELAELRLDKTTIVAPFDGVIGQLNIEAGSVVNPQTPIAEFASDRLEVVIDVEENRIEQLSEGQSATLELPSFPDTSFPAVVNNIDPTGSTDTHTFAVEIIPRDDDQRLKSGMYSRVTLLADRSQDAPLVPRAAVVDRNGEPTVYVIDDDNIARERAVTTGLENDRQIEILSGLEPGEQVVVAGQNNLTDGATVEIVSGL